MNIFEKVILLDGRCRFWNCGCRNELEVHHIIPKSQGIINELWNLISLCPIHHHLITINQVTDIDLLSKLQCKMDFRWQTALDWHLQRQALKNIKKGI